METEVYTAVLRAAQQTVEKRDMKAAPVAFSDIKVSEVYLKVFWFVTRAVRKIMRRFQK